MIDSLIGQGINVRHACRVLGVSESGYYAWKDRPDPPRTLRRLWLAGEIADVHQASGGTYGEMRVTADLRYGRLSPEETAAFISEWVLAHIKDEDMKYRDYLLARGVH